VHFQATFFGFTPVPIALICTEGNLQSAICNLQLHKETATETTTIHFVETMRGYGAVLVPQTNGADAPQRRVLEDDRLVEQTLAQASQEGRAFPLALRRLAVAVHTAAPSDDGGLRGVVTGGIVEATGLDEQALVVEHGEFELLPKATGGERRMHYRLYCRTQSGQRQFLIAGFKRIANHSAAPLPLAIWSETTMLYVFIYELAEHGEDALTEPPGPLVATGVARIHWADFARQLLTFRSRGTPRVMGHVLNLWAFTRFFVAALASVYLRGNA